MAVIQLREACPNLPRFIHNSPRKLLRPGCRLVAWGEDTSGNEKYTLRVRDIATGELPAASAGSDEC